MGLPGSRVLHLEGTLVCCFCLVIFLTRELREKVWFVSVLFLLLVNALCIWIGSMFSQIWLVRYGDLLWLNCLQDLCFLEHLVLSVLFFKAFPRMDILCPFLFMFSEGLTITKAMLGKWHSHLRGLTDFFRFYIDVYNLLHSVLSILCVCTCLHACVYAHTHAHILVWMSTLYENSISGHLYLLAFERM